MRMCRVGNSKGAIKLRRAFTLVELLAVLLMSALLAALVGMSLHRRHRAAQFDQVVQRASDFDRRTREQAVRFARPMQITIDASTATMRRHESMIDATTASPWVAPPGYTLHCLMPADDADPGTVVIAYSTHGFSPSYALEFGRGAGERRWLLVAGLTGQHVITRHENEVTDARALLATTNR